MHGTYRARARHRRRPDSFAASSYTGTMKITGGTGVYQLAKGTGTLTCTSAGFRPPELPRAPQARAGFSREFSAVCLRPRRPGQDGRSRQPLRPGRLGIPRACQARRALASERRELVLQASDREHRVTAAGQAHTGAGDGAQLGAEAREREPIGRPGCPGRVQGAQPHELGPQNREPAGQEARRVAPAWCRDRVGRGGRRRCRSPGLRAQLQRGQGLWPSCTASAQTEREHSGQEQTSQRRRTCRRRSSSAIVSALARWCTVAMPSCAAGSRLDGMSSTNTQPLGGHADPLRRQRVDLRCRACAGRPRRRW